jgi:hypothetical protein
MNPVAEAKRNSVATPESGRVNGGQKQDTNSRKIRQCYSAMTFENLHMLTVLSTLGPHCLDAGMVDASLSRGFDADLSIFRSFDLSNAGTLSKRFRQVVAFPLSLLGLDQIIS